VRIAFVKSKERIVQLKRERAGVRQLFLGNHSELRTPARSRKVKNEPLMRGMSACLDDETSPGLQSVSNALFFRIKYQKTL